MMSQIFSIHEIQDVHAKNLDASLFFVDFSKAFDSIHRGKMEQILLVYGRPKEIMMLYKTMKVSFSLDGDTDYFVIVAGVLQRDTLTLYMLIICLDQVLQTSIDIKKENGFTQAKKEAKVTPHKLLWTRTMLTT